MATNYDFDLLNEAIEHAPVAGFGPRVTFGKLSLVEILVCSFEGAKGNRKFVTQPYKSGEKVPEGSYLRLKLSVDIKELNPALTFEWNRNVDIKNSGDKTKTDWSEIVLPAFTTVLGADWLKKISKGVYVEVEDAETIELDKNGNKKSWQPKDTATGAPKVDDLGNAVIYTNTAPRVLKMFKNKAECDAARQEKFKKQEEISDSGIPVSVIADVRGMLTAGLDEDEIKEVLSTSAPFSEYDTEKLLEEAKKAPF